MIIAVLLIGCQLPSMDPAARWKPIAEIGRIEWEVKSTEWPLGEGRYCYLFPADEPFAGCWEQYDDLKQQPYNRNDHPNDHAYHMKASLPENVKQALAEGHNQQAFCARDEAMHLSCRTI